MDEIKLIALKQEVLEIIKQLRKNYRYSLSDVSVESAMKQQKVTMIWRVVKRILNLSI